MAVDGSTATVPDEIEVKEHFGAWNVKDGQPCPKARVSQLFDVQNRITLDALIRPKSEGERDLAAQHFTKLMPSDLVLLDRRIPCGMAVHAYRLSWRPILRSCQNFPVECHQEVL